MSLRSEVFKPGVEDQEELHNRMESSGCRQDLGEHNGENAKVVEYSCSDVR